MTARPRKPQRLAMLKPRIAPLTPSKAGGWGAPPRGTRHERGYGAEWDRIRPRILTRDRYLCQTCLRAGRVTLGNIVDHIIPKAEGGSDDEANLEVICRAHHQEKTQRESDRARGAG